MSANTLHSAPLTVSLTALSTDNDLAQINGCVYHNINLAPICCTFSKHNSNPSSIISLMDDDAYDGMTGSDVKIIFTSDFHNTNFTGFEESTILNLLLVIATGVVQTHQCPICVILNQYAHYDKGHTTP
eukprot:4247830-Ditylum_brightwellii.AAC.1